MNTPTKTLSILTVLPLLIVSCQLQATQVQPEEQMAQKVVPYKAVLGKSLADQEVASFIVSNNCSSAAQFELCKDVGVALLVASDQIVKTVYLYLNNAEGFGPYQGELPFGLKFYDTMGAVEYKLKRQGVGNAGLPDSGDTPDHLHYWANYQQASLTVVYNSPSPEDEDATIYGVVVSQ
jgi:hypothetical protein